MTIYLAGKISGDPEYREKFEDAAQMLRGMGFQVLNPAELPQGWKPKDYMRVCLPMLLAAGCGIAMGNASEDVKQAADRVAPDCDENGFAYALRHFLTF